MISKAPITAVVALLFAVPCTASEPVRLETLDGSSMLLRRDDSEPALVAHFWATWCPECVEELPYLAEAAKTCAPSGIRVVTVNVGEDVETIREFLDIEKIDTVVLRDPHGRAWRELSGVGLPTNVTWTAQGRRLDVGPRDAGSWARALESLGCSLAASPATWKPTDESAQ